jgi:hypothetical protein
MNSTRSPKCHPAEQSRTSRAQADLVHRPRLGAHEVATVASPPHRGLDSKAMVPGRHKGGRIVLMAHEEAPVDATAISMRHLMKTTGKPEREIVDWAKREGHRVLRVRRGKTACFYVQPVGSHIRVCR